MPEKNDPTIKLFGKIIELGSNSHEDIVTASVIEPFAVVSAASAHFVFDSECTSSALNNILCSKQDDLEKVATEAGESRQEEEPSSNSVLEEPKTPISPSTNTENSEILTKDRACSSQDLPKKDQDQSDQTSSNSDSPDQTTLKKPDKIIPCPRCTSMDTKFCYFNNYNVNQPRHFCKSCQRYWTAGGSMRSVPVGAGRRKSKNCSASQPRHLVTPESSYGLVDHVMRPDGSVCAFGLDPSLANQSEASMLKVGGQLSNGFFGSENNNITSNCSSVSVEQGGNSIEGMKSCHTIPCYPYGWSPITWQPGLSMPFYSPYNLQWVPNSSMNSDRSSTNSCSPNSTSLGKHSREGTMLTTSNPEKKECSMETESRVAKPKTLRFFDPSDASKSSICTTVGIKKKNKSSTASARVALFRELQQAKSNVNYERTSNIISGVEASSMVLQANPAAFSRSLAFHEIAQ